MTDKPSSEITTSLENVYFYEDLVADQLDEYDLQFVEETSAAYAGYTAGTTGRPKGVYYSHRSMYLHTLDLISALKIDYLDCVMTVTPMFHAVSWGFPQGAVGAGAKIVLPGRFSADNIGFVADAMADENVIVANGPPPYSPRYSSISGSYLRLRICPTPV